MAEYLTRRQIGRVVDVVLHSKVNPLDTKKALRQKKTHTTLAQEARNNASSASNMALVALGNFAAGDLYATFTYDDEHMPPNIKAVKADGARFVRRLRALWRDFGEELKYMRVIEGLETGARYHHHMMIAAPKGADLDSLRAVLTKCWGVGMIQLERIGTQQGRSASDLCMYFYKEVKVFGRPAGDRAFTCSKNLDRGQPVTQIVTDGASVMIPADVPRDNVLIYDSREMLFSRYVHLRYILP